jgi:acyl-coenzyme A synthetase/AMP-(fatty) acid ligase
MWFRDNLPRTETGKLLKRELREEMSALLSDGSRQQS